MSRYRITWGKGLNADALPSELADGFCNNASHARFRNGFAERVLGAGVLQSHSGGFSIGYVGIYRTQLENALVSYLISYASTGSSTAPTVKCYRLSSSGAGAGQDITPPTVAGKTISSITYSSPYAVLTTSTPHGLGPDQRVTVSGVTPSAYNATFALVTPDPTDPNVFRYTPGSTPAGAATVMGSYTVLLSNTSTIPGAGNLPATDGVIGGIYLLNLPYDGLYYWNGDTSTDLAPVSGAYRAQVSRVFKQYIVQLGPTVDGVIFRKRIAWSSAAEPGALPSSFTAAATNDAGDIELAETGGNLVDCVPLGDSNIVYKDDCRYSMQYIGGAAIFQFTRLPGNDGLVKPGCAVNTPVGHVFMTPDFDIRVHSGGESRSIAQGRVRSLLSDLDYGYLSMAVHSEKNEVWIGTAGRILIWNWEDDTWGTGGFGANFANGSAGEYEDNRNIIISSSGDDIYRNDYIGHGSSSVVERSGLDVGEPDLAKNLQGSRWNFDGESGATYSIEHGSAMTADATPTYATAATYTLGTTDKVNSRATAGKYLSIKCTWNSSSATNPGKVRSTDLDVTPGGRR